ncbi:MAG: TRAP transporter substrate-binding protein DctP [Peptococcaceae bacterium]
MFKQKSKMGICIVLLVIMVTVAAGCGTPEKTGDASKDDKGEQAREDISLTLASFWPENHFVEASGNLYFMKRVEELSEGKIKFEYHPGSVLGPAQDAIEMINSGIADIAAVCPTYLSGAMPLSNVSALPGAITSGEHGTLVLHRLVTDRDSIFFKTDFERNGIIPLAAGTNTPYEIATTEKFGAIESVDDLKGLKLRSGGGPQDVAILALGATPIQTVAAEQYEAIARGVVDGGVFPIPSLISNRTYEVLKYSSYGVGMSSFAITISISERKWESLPDWAKDVLLKAGEETAAYQGKFFDETTDKSKKELESEYGIIFYELPQSEMTKIFEPVWGTWAKAHEDLGYPAQEAIEKWNEMSKQVLQEIK